MIDVLIWAAFIILYYGFEKMMRFFRSFTVKPRMRQDRTHASNGEINKSRRNERQDGRSIRSRS